MPVVPSADFIARCRCGAPFMPWIQRDDMELYLRCPGCLTCIPADADAAEVLVEIYEAHLEEAENAG